MRETTASTAIIWMSGPGRHRKKPTAHPMKRITEIRYKRLRSIMNVA